MKRIKYIIISFLVLFFLGCNDLFKECSISNAEENKRVLILGIDGLKSDAFMEADTPFMDEMMNNSQYTYSAKIDTSKSFSGPGWSTILTGVWFEKHQVNSNFFTVDNFNEYPMIHCRLDPISSSRTYTVTDWDEFSPLLEACSSSNEFATSARGVEDKVKKELESCDAKFIFSHILWVDNRGHNFGFDKSVVEYTDAITSIDQRVGNIMKIVKEREEVLKEEWLVVIATDHGGVKLDSPVGQFLGKHKDYGHLDEVSLVPLIFYSSSFQKKKIESEVTIVDIVPTILNWLEVEIDTSWGLDGKIIELN